jgi:hypothetical protein
MDVLKTWVGRAVRPGSPRSTLVAAAALVVVAVLPYLGSLRYPLLHDDRTLLDNTWLARDADLGSILSRDYWHGTDHAGSDLYRPLTILTLAWNLRAGAGAMPFRLTNALLHAAVALLVWWTLARVLRILGGPAGGGLDERPSIPAWIGAALFAAHPLASEAVLFAVGRAELLAAAFGLLAFQAALESGRARAGGVLAVALSAVLFLLALVSKESAAAWIAVLIGWRLAEWHARSARRNRIATVLIVWSGVLILFLAARARVVGWRPASPPWIDNPLVAVDLATRAANAVRLQAIYYLKMIAPLRLSVDYGFDQIPVLALIPWGATVMMAGIAAWAGAAWALARWSPAALFLWCFTPLAFAVTGNLLFPIGVVLAERLAYVPLIGACGLLGFLIWRWSPNPVIRVGIVVAGLIAAEARTAERSRDFRDLVTFVEATAAASPRAVKALANVGRTRLRTGHVHEAIDPLQRALQIWPDYPRALSLMADVEDRLGNSAAAEDYRRRARLAVERFGARGGEGPMESESGRRSLDEP